MDKRLQEANARHTSSDLHKHFKYCPTTGKLTWRVAKAQRIRVGTEAGTPHNKGYLSVVLDGTAYLVHRVIWCMVYGEWPGSLVDHADRDRSNNRLLNLRLGGSDGNSQNHAIRCDNTSGVKGVSWHKKTGKWSARIQANKRRWTVGYFNTPDEAGEILKIIREQLHKEYANHG